MTTATIPKEVLEELAVVLNASQLDPNMPACPDWCTLPAGHPWDSIVGTGGHGDLHESRGHQGPYFGQFVSIDGDETTKAPGTVTLQVGLVSEVEEAITTPADALELAGNLISAVAWIEAQR